KRNHRNREYHYTSQKETVTVTPGRTGVPARPKVQSKSAHRCGQEVAILAIAPCASSIASIGRAGTPVLPGVGVVRSDFAADQLKLLCPRIGRSDRPQHELVQTQRDVFAELPDDVLGRTKHAAVEELIRAATERREHRAHLIQRFLSRTRYSAKQNQTRLDSCVLTAIVRGVLANLGHARTVLSRGLKRCEIAVRQSRGSLQRGIGPPADPNIHGATIVVGARGGPWLDRDMVKV